MFDISFKAITGAVVLTATLAMNTGAMAASTAQNFWLYDNPNSLSYSGATAGFFVYGDDSRVTMNFGLADPFASQVPNADITAVQFESGLGAYMGGPLLLSATNAMPGFVQDAVPVDPAKAASQGWTGTAASISTNSGGITEVNQRLEVSFDLTGISYNDLLGKIGSQMGYRVALYLNGSELSGVTGPRHAGGHKPSAVPTPSAILGGLGLLGLVVARRRRRQADIS